MVSDDEMTAVVIHTPHYVIEGKIALVPGARLTDYIRDAVDFIAVTDVSVKGHDGTFRFKVPFLDLRRDSIEIVYPASIS
ncbi:MAG: hypothetical protein PF961_22385 [Planctomycetota bacterium]|jgi:hypothetical protein|nr:hypothetical protein [Planctomycetota bacterium]